LAVSFLGCYSRGHNFITTVFLLYFFLFNRILYIGTVSVQVLSVAHTLRDALPLGSQHVSSIVSSLRMGLILLPCSALLIFLLLCCLLTRDTRQNLQCGRFQLILIRVSLSHFDKSSKHSGRLRCKHLSQKTLKIIIQIQTLS